MPIKLDLGKAWETAMALLSANKSVVFIVAAVFFFLPSALLEVLVPPNEASAAMMGSATDVDPQAIVDANMAYLIQYWWVFAVYILITALGTLSLLALLTNRMRPTVGEAIGIAAKSLPTYIAVIVISFIIAFLVIALPTALGGAVNPALGVLFALIGLVINIYISVKLALTSAVIAIEEVLNPFKVIARSWRLTKGNSLRLFAFLLLLILVVIVLMLIAMLVLSIFTIFGDQIGLFAVAIGGSFLSMAITCVFIAVQAAVHRQLSGGTAPEVRDTFE